MKIINEKLNKKTVTTILITAVSLILVAGAITACFGVRNYRLQKSVEFTYMGMLQTDSVRDIEIDADEQAKRVDEMKRKGQTGRFGFFCNSEMNLQYKTAYGSLVLANVSTNDCIFVVSILDENGNLIYRSGGIEPGRYLSQIRLFSPPEDGEHDCRVYVSAYDKATFELVGVQYTSLLLRIGEFENEVTKAE